MCQTKSTFFCVLAVLISYGAGIKTPEQDPKCLLPMDAGPCRMKLERFYYNKQSNTCETFTFGGCRGNDNKFGFLKTCEDTCVRRPVNNSPAAPRDTSSSFRIANNSPSSANSVKITNTPSHRADKTVT